MYIQALMSSYVIIIKNLTYDIDYIHNTKTDGLLKDESLLIPSHPFSIKNETISCLLEKSTVTEKKKQ